MSFSTDLVLKPLSYIFFNVKSRKYCIAYCFLEKKLNYLKSKMPLYITVSS